MAASPFPGMDPYLERHWLDVHGRLVTYAADAINGLLPDDLVARSEERIAVASRDDEARRRYLGPDVRVFEIARFGATRRARGGPRSRGGRSFGTVPFGVARRPDPRTLHRDS